MCILGGIIYRVSKLFYMQNGTFGLPKLKFTAAFALAKIERDRERKGKTEIKVLVKYVDLIWRGRDAAEGVEGVGYLGVIFHFFAVEFTDLSFGAVSNFR